jgi:hypothetical protein
MPDFSIDDNNNVPPEKRHKPRRPSENPREKLSENFSR